MPRRPRIVIVSWVCLSFVSGCSNGPKQAQLAPGDGTVTYQGRPLAGATVTFVPKTGPIAQAVTDLNGNFTLSTGSLPGVAVGDVQVSVSAFAPGSSSSAGSDTAPKPPGSPADSTAFLKNAGDMQQAMAQGKIAEGGQSKPTIPEKYIKAETSGLNFTVKPGGDNHFKIELQD